jgi:dipeptidyl aminopeptidase/acylaminoacyl peptidase
MTIRAAKFTPEVLLEAPRRSAGLPNSDASQILYSVSTYSFAQHAKQSEIRILDAESQQTSLITDDKSVSEPVWIDDKTIVLLRSEDNGTTSVVVGDPKNFAKRYMISKVNEYSSPDKTIATTLLVPYPAP